MTTYTHVVVLQPYDPAAAAVTTLRYADRDFSTEPTDSLASTRIEPRVAKFDLTRSLYREKRIGGRSQPATGTIVLLNTDGALDDLATYAWGYRAVTILRGADTDSWDEFETVFVGVAQTIAFDDGSATITYRDNAWKLDKPLRGRIPSGDGVGQLYPYTGGNPFYCAVAPIANGLTFQCHKGAIDAINAVYDKGVALTGGGVNYTTNLASGQFTLTAVPAGLITAELLNQVTSSTRPADILRDIAVDAGGLSDPAEIDTAAFSALYTLLNVEAGIFIGPSEDPTVAEAMDRLCNPFGLYWYLTRAAALLTCGRFDAPSGTSVAEIDDYECVAFRLLPWGPPVWQVSVTGRRYFSEHGAADIASGVTGSTRQGLLQGFADTGYASDSSIRTAYADADTLEITEGCHVSTIEAGNEATRLLALYGVRRLLIEIVLAEQNWSYELNDVVTFRTGRYGIDGEQQFRVIGILEEPTARRTTLTLWG